jgi:hypothetical protein
MGKSKRDSGTSIEQTLADCREAGNRPIPGVDPVQSELKRDTSLVGLAYLNYIYQNDIKNRHFCESMLLMSSQVPAGTKNPYTRLFKPKAAKKTMAALADVQLCFDYAIARSNPPEDVVQASLAGLRKILK